MPSFTVFKGSSEGAPQQATITKPDDYLTGDQVFLKISASGLCGTDLHFRTIDMALGHEGVGVVEALGPEVKFLRKGDRVGWGYEYDSCGRCNQCLTGRENYCPERQVYGNANLDQGSFATHAVWREAFLFKIPNDLSDEAAAPMQCGGATVWNALQAYNAQPFETVGIMGIGGLGHLAIQFAAKMGCHVVALSGSDRKKDEAIKLGAHEFITVQNQGKIHVSKQLNRLLVTTSDQPDWDLLMPMLAPNATIHPLYAAQGHLSIPYIHHRLLAQDVHQYCSRRLHNAGFLPGLFRHF